MQISTVCINCDARTAASPILLFSITHLYQDTGPASLPFSPKWNLKLLLSTSSPATTASHQVQMLMVELMWQHSWKENLSASSNLSNRRKLQHENNFDAAAYLLVSLTLSCKQVSPGHYCSFTHFQTPCSTYLPWIYTSPISNTSLYSKLLISTLTKAQLWSERHWHWSSRTTKQKPGMTTFLLAYMLLGLLLKY